MATPSAQAAGIQAHGHDDETETRPYQTLGSSRRSLLHWTICARRKSQYREKLVGEQFYLQVSAGVLEKGVIFPTRSTSYPPRQAPGEQCQVVCR
jgi:hypothetical protein